MTSAGEDETVVQVPWSFDTTSVWHTILKGGFGLNALLALALVVKLLSRRWLDAAGVCVAEGLVAGFTVVFIRHQEGSRGTLFRDRVTVEPNAVFGIPLPGPGARTRSTNSEGSRWSFAREDRTRTRTPPGPTSWSG